jgi:outer membrane protein assembly factor BamA
MKRGVLVALWLVLFMPLMGWAEDPPAGTVSEIRFVGNKTTKETVLLQEMSIHVGDPIDKQKIEKSRQAIMNLGLFKTVEATMEGSVLVITVKERFYILPLPLLDIRPDGNYSYGGELRLDNLAGLNQRLKLSYETKSSLTQDIPPSQEAKLSYSYPRMIHTPYQLDFSSNFKRSEFNWPDNITPQAHYRLRSWNTSVGASRWALDNGESRGWRYGGGAAYALNEYRLLDGVAGSLVDGQAVSVFATMDYLDVNEHLFYREGETYGARAELGMPILGSDYHFSREQLYYRSYRHSPASGVNFNSQWQVGYANGCAFGCAAWSLGGSTSLRGYDPAYVTGNIYALVNLEYHYPLSGFRQFRGVLFTDIGDAWPDLESVTLNKLKSSVGVGFRWTVQSFVNLTLRVDYGYALETGLSHTYFSTSASF